jgi:hypothetical protein
VSDFFEIDANGIRSDFTWNENDQEYKINRTQDVEPVLDWTKAVANEVGMNREDIKRGWWLYAKLPAIVILQMRAKGINVYDQNDQKRMFEEINTNYPYLKTTTGSVEGKSKLVFP